MKTKRTTKPPAKATAAKKAPARKPATAMARRADYGAPIDGFIASLILVGPPDAFADPEGRLGGEARGGRTLRLTSLDELPRQAVRGWLRTAAAVARMARGA